ncbi:DUF6891 domain-containing protein [Parachitinimonas caeni]|uniref:DUF6891 domain-containing protein n=1 Tax=Parachitinimonas caeni TaxID=3031301 RepID=A0ABT7E120_9NEIS|nr:hypothetical protein [Parachitinimonas caeni]MDK2126003.1 hypothetical protein [Parachitinimonas caeni]
MNQEIVDAVRRLVWSGLFPGDEIPEIVHEVFAEEKLDRKAVSSQIASELARKAEAERSWPNKTDCDRLDSAFDTLDDGGIIALQNAGYTHEDGVSECSEVYHDRGGAKSGITGYCFYHGQDLEQAVDGQGLYIAVGAFSGKEADKQAVAAKVVEVLQKKGLNAKWSGSAGARIELPEFRWQKRGGG